MMPTRARRDMIRMIPINKGIVAVISIGSRNICNPSVCLAVSHDRHHSQPREHRKLIAYIENKCRRIVPQWVVISSIVSTTPMRWTAIQVIQIDTPDLNTCSPANSFILCIPSSEPCMNAQGATTFILRKIKPLRLSIHRYSYQHHRQDIKLFHCPISNLSVRSMSIPQLYFHTLAL